MSSTISFPSPTSNDGGGFGSHLHKRSSSMDDSSIDEHGVLVSHSSSGSSHNNHHHHTHNHSLSSSGIAFYPASYDPSASTSSFQMNPLSAHPPRTPRTSIMGGGSGGGPNHGGANMSMSMMSVGMGMGMSSQFGYASAASPGFGAGLSASVSTVNNNGNSSSSYNPNFSHNSSRIRTGSGEFAREKGEPDFGGDGGDDDDEDDVDDEVLEQRAGQKVRKEEIWREMLASSTGRDKALKLIQYTIKVYLFFHTSLRSRWTVRQSRATWETNMLERLDKTTSGLSLARKCLIMFNWLTPFITITAPQRIPFTASATTFGGKKPPPKPPLLHTFLHASPPLLLDMLNGLADDIATFSRLGLIGQRVGTKAARLADWCWFSATLVGLVEVGVEQGMVKNLMDEAEARLFAATFGADGQPIMAGSTNNVHIQELEKELDRVRKQYFWLRVSRAKLILDLIFVSYECFKLQRGRRAIMPISGLMSAILSSVKLYDRYRTILMKAVSTS